MLKKFCVTILLGGLVSCTVNAPRESVKKETPCRESAQDCRQRAKAIVAQMTLDEKLRLVDMNSQEVQRFGIKEHHWWSEALHGVARNGKATQFPQSISMASTFNPQLIESMATAISDEARAKHHNTGDNRLRFQGLTIWSPTINLGRDPRWGRSEETYGEDPLLTGRVGTAFVKGLQGDDPKYLKVAATVKHFVCNNTEYNRTSVRPDIPEKILRDYYLPPYKMAVEEGKVESIMTAYNGINNVPCATNKRLLTDVLRNEWGFEGTVVTDVSAPERLKNDHKTTSSHEESARQMLDAGVNVFCSKLQFSDFVKKAIEKGDMHEALLDRAVIQNLTTRIKLGALDEESVNPYAQIPMEVVGKKEHVAIARKIAQQGTVLLKNDYSVLPVNKAKVKRIIVAGPYADIAQLGGYSGTPTHPAVSVLEGLQTRFGKDIKVDHVYIDDDFQAIPTKHLRPAAGRTDVNGVKGEYFQGIVKGKLANEKPVATRLDKNIDFHWLKPLSNIDPLIPRPNFTVRWSGVIVPPKDGEYQLALRSDDGARLWFNGQKLYDTWKNHGKERVSFAPVQLKGGQEYPFTMEYFDNKGNARAHLEWKFPRWDPASLAKVSASESEETLVVYVGGFNMHMADEFRDLMDLSLPVQQEAHIKNLRKAYKNMLVILNGGTCVLSDWMMKNVPAVMHAWYPGQEGGHAVADLISGDVSPSGRLPFTYYKETESLPDFDDYDIRKGRTYMYYKGDIHFPFGHGLSYTKFDYSDLNLANTYRAGDTIDVSFKLKNTGTYDGDEVVQLYVSQQKEGAPAKQLKDFKRVSLKKGADSKVQLSVSLKDLMQWDEIQNKYVLEKGEYSISIGGSSVDQNLRKSITIQ